MTIALIDPREHAAAITAAPARVTLANGHGFAAAPGQTLLDAAQAAGLVLDHSCRNGRCGTCKAQVVAGPTRALRPEWAITPLETQARWVLTCAREALGDVTLGIDDLAGPLPPAPRTWPCRIDTLDALGPDLLRVRLRLPPQAGFSHWPGQSVELIGPSGVRRSYSVANDDPNDPRLELHLRRVDGGALSGYWFERARPGDLLRLHGPLGTFFLHDVAGLQLVLLATGTGFAPIQSLLGALRRLPAAAQPASVRLYWGVRHGDEHYAEPQPAGPRWQYRPVLSGDAPGWTGARGHVQDVALADGVDAAASAVYACGSPAMVEAAHARFVAHGLDRRRFHCDAFVAAA